jgi:hypothetical protein
VKISTEEWNLARTWMLECHGSEMYGGWRLESRGVVLKSCEFF